MLTDDIYARCVDAKLYLRYHHVGVDNALPVHSLCDLFEVPDRRWREFRELDENADVCANDEGCWYAETWDDYEPELVWRKKRLVAEARAISKLKKRRARRFPNFQPRLWRAA